MPRSPGTGPRGPCWAAHQNSLAWPLCSFVSSANSPKGGRNSNGELWASYWKRRQIHCVHLHENVAIKYSSLCMWWCTTDPLSLQCICIVYPQWGWWLSYEPFIISYLNTILSLLPWIRMSGYNIDLCGPSTDSTFLWARGLVPRAWQERPGTTASHVVSGPVPSRPQATAAVVVIVLGNIEASVLFSFWFSSS